MIPYTCLFIIHIDIRCNNNSFIYYSTLNGCNGNGDNNNNAIMCNKLKLERMSIFYPILYLFVENVYIQLYIAMKFRILFSTNFVEYEYINSFLYILIILFHI